MVLDTGELINLGLAQMLGKVKHNINKNMARNVWDEPIDKNIPWDGNKNTNNLPVRGRRVEEFLKDSLNSKIGVLYYDATNNRYLAFTDEEERDKYLADPTLTYLVLATFDAPFNYSAEITLQTPSYNAVFLNSTGNYIDFTFDIVNKQGASTGENVIISYTFIRNANKQVVTETRKFGDIVHFNIDKYLGEGTNTIIVGITGQTTLAATTTAITYQVVNLTLSDDLNIARYYNISKGPQQVEIPFTVSGYGTKIVEWYIDGELLDFIKTEDEVVDVIATRTKYITLSNLNQGSHSLQIRAYTVINGERFYTDTLYRDLLIYTGTSNNVIIGIATTIPKDYGILGSGDKVSIYEMTQYVPYTLRFATYSPLNAAATEVVVMLDDETIGITTSKNGIENEFIITSKISGNRNLKLISDKVTKELVASIKKTSMNIEEIEGAIIDFNALGKNNESSNRDTWTNGIYTGILRGFNWNNTSGWVNGRLEMNAGSSFAINYAPLNDNPTNSGKTIEIEWSTKNVTNDDAIICDLRNNNGVGIVIRATKVSMISADGVIVETEYKSDENVRIGFVINRSEGTTNRRLSFIYTNGIVSRAEQWASTDNYNSDKEIEFYATNEAEVSLKSIKIYNNALSSDNMLNNFILYRDTISEMMEVYDRNDVYEEGTTTFSPDKMMNRLPVMIVTGDIPILENTSDKDEQIVVDIEYYNVQDPSRSFTMKNAAMRPQGTSSMGYPKKNFRIYTQKVANTELYDSTGTLVENKLYSFKDKAQPVDCWCLKADYAESSGTHNVGIAKLWNDALYNAQIDGEYKLRTNAQKIALNNKYNYDVRTTIDGFPILLFYRLQENDDLIFIGKYNFNNDKSTEKVFGFTDIPEFDNSRMQCWEVLNNGNPLALFTSTEGFDDNWSEAFESRYPDTKTPNTSDLKSFCEWMTNVSREDFVTQKWEHLDVYKMAAYWIYLMRHAAADQFVKNAMFTSEDGIHFYYILYDNDTINGLINSGYLRIKPTDGRQTIDDTGSYVFAGHDSKLWNLLEADEEFMNILSDVDNALYTAGISYDNTIRIFDEEQADKWVEKVYNQDAQYKYIGPYIEKGINNLFMLQGKRDLHRKWWLAKRFSIFDAKYVSGSYKSQAIEIKCLNGTEVGQKFTIKAGYPLDYGYGINNIPRSFGITLDIGETHEFTTQEVINIGDPLRIYGAPNIAELDFSKMSDRLAVVTIANVYADNLGTKLTKLILGNPNKINAEISEISGLKQAIALEELDIQGMSKMVSIDLSNHQYFKKLKAFGSNLSSVTFAKGAPVERVELPTTMRVLAFEQLPLLDGSNVVMEDITNVQYIIVNSCPNISNDFEFINNWYKTKNYEDKQCSLTMDNVSWNVETVSDFIDLLSLKAYNALSLKGVVVIPNITVEQIYEIRDILGETAFDPDAELYIDVPTILQINSDTNTMLDGSSLQFSSLVYPLVDGTYEWSVSGREGASIDNNGLLVVSESGLDNSSVVVNLKFTSVEGEVLNASKSILVEKRIYPSADSISIIGEEDPRISSVYSWETTTTGVNGDIIAEWAIGGNASSYWEISNSTSGTCDLTKKKPMVQNTSGTLSLILKKKFNNSIIATVTKNLNMPVVFPSNITINGDSDPTKGDQTYSWYTTTANVNGDYYAEWSLSGDITSIVTIATQDTTQCVMRTLGVPVNLVSGTLTLVLKRTGNNSVILTQTKTLEAMLEGVIITKTSNPGVQAALYNAGLVTNEDYSLQEEVEKITADQLQPGTSYSTSIFYSQRRVLQNFNEFKYFTGVTTIKSYTFSNGSSYPGYGYISEITLPNTVTSISSNAFQGASLKSIIIPEGVTSIGSNCFKSCAFLVEITLPTTLVSMGQNCFSSTEISKVHIKESYFETYCKIFLQYENQSPFRSGNNAMFYIDGNPINHLVIPESVSEISNVNFANYGGDSVDLGSHNLSISFGVFENSNIKTIIGGSNTTISHSGNFNGVDDNIKLPDANFALLKHLYNDRVKPFYYSSSSYYNPVDVNIGENTFTTVSPWVFSDGSTSKKMTIVNTGVVQDYTDILKLGGASITISSNKPESQFKIDYVDIDSGENATMTVDGAGTYIIPMKTLSYTVTGITNYEGLVSQSVKSTSASCTCNYFEKTDIYIQHINGTLYTTDEWTAGGYANDQANGVAVVCASTSFVIAKTNTSTAAIWSSDTRNLVEGVFTTETKSVVLTDFAGAANTALMLATDTSGAAYTCNNYIFPNGARGYLPASGELNVAYQNKASIDAALTLIGGDTLIRYTHWTSTQHSANKAWRLSLSSGNISNDLKAGATTVRAFTSLN